MSRRNLVFANNEIYHVFNRSIARQPIFADKKSNDRALDLIWYYRFSELSLRFSHFKRLKEEEKKLYVKNLESGSNKQVNVLAFCLMPSHFHFLIRQNKDNGISSYIGTFQNSYAKYLNKKTKRSGSLFQHMFKAVRIETDEQFVHVARYIHLNPYSSYLLKEIKDIADYEWSSLKHYLKNDSSLVDTELLLSLYPDIHELRKFTLNNADYQRKLDEIKHLTLGYT